MSKYAIVSGNAVMYSDGTKEIIKPATKAPRKKAVKVGSKVMVNFNPKLIGIVTSKVTEHDGWFEFQITEGKDKNKSSRCHKKLLTVIG